MPKGTKHVLTTHKPRTIFLVTGDVSGDQNGGRLAAAIREVAPDVRLVGAGGAAMREAGIEMAIETTQFSVVGFFDALRIGKHLLRTYRRVQAQVKALQPDVVILIDSETVAVPFARWLRRQRLPVVFFFPPQVWLWGRWRLNWVQPLARRVISAFRPEADLYQGAGADTVWVGHPLADVVHVREDTTAALRDIGLDPARALVALMPGSRRREIKALVAPILETARRLQARDPALQFALPLASEAFRAEIQEGVRRSGVRDLVVYRPRSYAVLSRAQVVIQCSGTASLETALLGIPSVIAYRCNLLEYVVARYAFMHVDYIGMPNILLGEMVQPEFFNKHVDADHLADAAWSLLTDQRRRRAIQSRLAEIRQQLGSSGVFPRAAQAVLDLLPEAANGAQPRALAG